ncbi:hypothetical protein HK096_005340 [Nowakowskiella sp. JEL0078]|nr:hypothetical protein HK096_005340 [Nowakowskiella sp. JEL0078]
MILIPEARNPKGKRDKYWWENLWYYGYYGSFVAFIIASFYDPRETPTQAAKLEAHKRLAERGETFGWPLPPDYALVKSEAK